MVWRWCDALTILAVDVTSQETDHAPPVAVWREAPLFTARERAALAWTEAVTLVAESRVPDEIYEAARAEFSEQAWST